MPAFWTVGTRLDNQLNRWKYSVVTDKNRTILVVLLSKLTLYKETRWQTVNAAITENNNEKEDSKQSNKKVSVLPAKRDSNVMSCLQSYQGLRIDRSLMY